MASGAVRRNSASSATSIPLLVKDLDGGTRQLDVPTDANVDEIRSLILGDSNTKDGASPDDFRLAIGDATIEPGLTLSETPVIPAYSYATSLLQVIGNSRLEPDKTAEALSSVNGVVRSLSNGVTDVNALCAAAGTSVRDSLTEPSMFEVSNSVNELFPSSGPNPSSDPNGWADAPSPALLVRKLSKHLPDHFMHEASQDFIRNSMRSELGDFSKLDDVAEFDRMLAQTPGGQPSIQDIAKARRMRNSAKRAEEAAALGNPDDDMNALLCTGNLSRPGSANMAVPDIAAQSAAAAASGFGRKSAIMAPSAGSTWMENVMQTWSVGIVDRSGALQNTPDGQKLKNHLNAIDDDKDMPDADIDTPDGSSTHASMDVDTVSSQSSAPSVIPPTLPQASLSEMISNKNKPTAAMPTQPNLPCAALQVPGRLTIPGVSPSVRRATPIAPSPIQSNIIGGVASVPGVGNAATPANRGEPSGIQFRNTPIKRGRKLKNPNLSVEQRKQMRKEQKRKSARESRIRKKTMEEGYQNKLKLLISENGTLKKQVNDLTHRLQVLQGLLTVTVRPVSNRPTMPRPSQLVVPPTMTNPTSHLVNGGTMGTSMGGNPMMGGPTVGGNPMGFSAHQRRFDNSLGMMSHAPPPSGQPAFGSNLRDPNTNVQQPLLTRSVRTQLSRIV